MFMMKKNKEKILFYYIQKFKYLSAFASIIKFLNPKIFFSLPTSDPLTNYIRICKLINSADTMEKRDVMIKETLHLRFRHQRK